MAPPQHSAQYVPKDALGLAVQGGLIVGGAGALLSATQNSLSKQNIGALGFITRTGSTIGLFAGAGTTYMFFKSASANLRESDDYVNSAIGGFFAGAVLGVKFRTMPAVLGYASAASVIMAIYEITGGSLRGFGDKSFDIYEWKEKFRATHRRPVEELIETLGDNPLTRDPEYETRRRERLKAKYGVVVPE
ncbi:mitochondrial import inner membrane translocase subunit Tim17 family protein [Peziza echinospora]|nr:mitochondrial import inner membrane translocase subunit Tim17 family protein [Peziza echinospora]